MPHLQVMWLQAAVFSTILPQFGHFLKPGGRVSWGQTRSLCHLWHVEHKANSHWGTLHFIPRPGLVLRMRIDGWAGHHSICGAVWSAWKTTAVNQVFATDSVWFSEVSAHINWPNGITGHCSDSFPPRTGMSEMFSVHSSNSWIFGWLSPSL